MLSSVWARFIILASDKHGCVSWAQARLNNTFLGAAFITDESPPAAHRYTGLRFQITYVYYTYVAPVAEWDLPHYATEPPITVDRSLCDIVNCTGKKGTDVMNVMDQQVEAKGITRADFVTGVGDGGGENEGRHSGVHKICEDATPSYVKRRCFGHLPWRVAMQGLVAMGPLYSSLKHLCAYLRDGITWMRLKAIAVNKPAAGGLGLMTATSAAYNKLFGVAPPSILEERPETVYTFLRWLTPKQTVLAHLVEQDLATRTLESRGPPAALATLQSREDCIHRPIAAVLLYKSMYLYRYIKKHQLICINDNLTELAKKASDIITNLRIEDDLFEAIDESKSELIANGVPVDTTFSWVELAVNLIRDISDEEADQRMPAAVRFHQVVSLKMASHLSLTISNIDGTTWLAARLLSRDAGKAKAGAKELHDKLVRIRPGRATPFEQSILSNAGLMEELDAFATNPNPCLLWHMGGRFKGLFRFLAPRFLSAPDSVLDAEGVHARWQWICLTRRGIKFHSLNAVLKLHDFTNRYGRFPQYTELRPYMDQAVAADQALYNRVVADPNVVGNYRHVMYSARFCLRPSDMELMRAAVGDSEADRESAVTQWGQYIRFLLEPHHFYNFPALNHRRWLLVAENKSLPNREARVEGDAIGRPLTILWYEESDLGGTDVHVVPVSNDVGRFDLMEATIAEISSAAGYHPPLPRDASARDHEILHERHFLDHNVSVCEGNRVSYDMGGDTGPDWSFVLSQDTHDVEQYCFSQRRFADLTKMALARQLQLRDGLTNEQRDALWALNKTTLMNSLVHGAGRGRAAGAGAAAGVAVGVAAPVGARGRGRGGRGRRGGGGGG